jgi:hypothetical protein
MTRRKTGLSGTNGKRSLGLIAVMLLVGLLLAALTTAPAGAGGSSATAAKKKKKTCPAGTQKVTVKKHGKKKKRCVAIPVTPAPVATAAAKLTIDQASFAYPDTQHHTGPCSTPPCPIHAFTVTNSGGSASGVPVASITELTQPVTGGGAHDPAFVVSANTCTAALPPAGTCTVTVQFIPPSNAGDMNYTSVLHVTAATGGDAQSALSGHAL